MNLWPIYDFLVHPVQTYIVLTGDCLYNALVKTLSGNADNRPSREQLLTLRDSALELARFIEDELLNRDAEAKDCDDPDCAVCLRHSYSNYSDPREA